MSSELAIRAAGLSKCYALFDRPIDRLKQMLWRGRRRYYREFWALQQVSLDVRSGEVLGIVGRNGAGKSTLLQLICGTLLPTTGSLAVNGRVAALLELGAGFNPEFTGRENVFLSAAILGLGDREIEARFDEIVDFSGIRDFIDQPVKTYSSGMFVRLAFSVATSVDPDILVIDEALSVGDGAFARKSFDRIMALRQRGATILFCSHAMYHIDAICDRALWLHDGRVEMHDTPSRVVPAYSAYLEGRPDSTSAPPAVNSGPAGGARISGITVRVDGCAGRAVAVRSRKSTVVISVDFVSDPQLPCPSVGIGILSAQGVAIASAGSFNDGVLLKRDPAGSGRGQLVLPDLPLLKGEYAISVFLLCERGIHIYDHAERCATLHVSQDDLEQGVVSLAHHWELA